MGKIVDIIYPGKVYTASVGPAQIEKNIKSAISVMDLKDLEINLICTDSENETIQDTKSVRKRNFKSYLKDKLYSSNLIYIIVQELRILIFIINYLKRKKYKPDIVVFHHLSAFYYFNKLSKLNTKKIIYQHTNGDPFSMLEMKFGISSESKIFNAIKKKLLKALQWADRIIFISDNGYSNFKQNYPTLSNKAILIKNGIPFRPFKNKEFLRNGIINLVSVGTISTRKGQDIIIKALSNIKEPQRGRFHLYLVGTGPQEKQFKEFVSELKLDNYVTFLGKMDQEDIINLLNHIDFMILMSYSEGLPISLIEGLRSGVPIITTNTDGCPETVENNGYILDKGDYNTLSNILLNTNETEIRKFSLKSRELFEKEFDIQNYVRKYLHLLRNI